LITLTVVETARTTKNTIKAAGCLAALMANEIYRTDSFQRDAKNSARQYTIQKRKLFVRRSGSCNLNRLLKAKNPDDIAVEKLFDNLRAKPFHFPLVA